MFRYFEALNRAPAVDETPALPVKEQAERPKLSALPAPTSATRVPYAVVPAGTHVAAALARTGEIQKLTETFAASVNASAGGRLAPASCSTGDGSTTVAAAIALDLSQRPERPHLAGRRQFATCQFLTHVRNGRDHARSKRESSDALRLSPTKWARLEIANLKLTIDKPEYEQTFSELGHRIAVFPAAIIDLGNVRVDSRALPLVRDNDPMLLVVRAGYTRRQELLAATAILINGGQTCLRRRDQRRRAGNAQLDSTLSRKRNLRTRCDFINDHRLRTEYCFRLIRA
jgi:hypothetical protein